jgi:dipeptidyl aminopeptidase/acylaminoacyl peptidase
MFQMVTERVGLRHFGAALMFCCATAAHPTVASAQHTQVANGVPGAADRVVRFRDRRIDLRPFFEGFPYLGFRAELEAQRLLYFHDTPSGRRLLQLPVSIGDQVVDLTHGEPLGDIDWNRRILRDLLYVPSRSQYIVLADEANEERYNLYTMSPDTGALQRITNHDYVYGFGLDKRKTRLGYIPRHGARAPYHSCLRVIDLSNMSDREVVCDTPELTFTWSDVNFRPDGTGVVISVLRASDRSHENLIYVDLVAQNPSLSLLTEVSTRRRNVDTLRDWIDNDNFVYTSDESGFTNLYRFNLPLHEPTQLTRLTEDVDSMVTFAQQRPWSPEQQRALFATTAIARPVAVLNSRPEDAVPPVAFYVGAMVKRPYESELFVVDPTAGSIVARRVFDESYAPLDNRENGALFSAQSRRRMFALQQLTVQSAPGASTAEIVPRERATVSEAVARAVETCTVERVSIDTFDQDPRTNSTRRLHAYVHRPTHPPRHASQRFAFVTAFYGGENRWDTQAQILCAAGAIVLSPAVRGSAGFGADFAALNDHDLGGNEIIDLMYVSRWLARTEHLQEQQIGVYGGSHGGYATMRALTMPEEVNGHREQFNWGFGVSWFGFSNIVTFHERCNIPDWVLLEAGNPATEGPRLLDRSPISHVARLRSPLLLLHGENDNRVPVRESRQMAEALRAAHKPVVYVEFEGQGHGLKGLANQQRVWTAVFRFLEQQAHMGVAPATRPGLKDRSKRVLPWLVLFAVFAVIAGLRAETTSKQ